MIIEGFLNILLSLLKFVFSWLNLPDFPAEFTENIDNFLDMIFDNLSLLGFFIRPATLTLLIPVLILVLEFDKVYFFILWVLKKIPFLDIK